MTRLLNRPLPTQFRSDEQGIAMITALLIMMICTVVVTASLALAVRSNGQSADQRNLTAALHAADYGLQAELAYLARQPSANTCVPVTGTLLPNTSLPAQWFSVTLSGCTPNALGGTMTVIATGYALGEGSTPTTSAGTTTVPAAAVSRTEVAHVTLQPDGALSNGGYGFPDAILALKGSGAQTGAISGSGLTVSNGPASIRADGPVTLTGGQLSLSSGTSTNSLSSWDDITLNSTPVTGNVASAKAVNLNSSNVSGYVDGTTVNLGTPASTVGSSRGGTVKLPIQPPVPSFNYSVGDWQSLTGTVGVTPPTICPSPGGTLSGLYVFSTSCTLAPSAVTGAVAVIVNAPATNLTVTLPSFLGPGSQLYLIMTNANGNLTLSDGGALTPVFAYGAGTLTVAGSTIVGQLVGGNIAVSAPTNLIAQTVSTTVSGTVTFPPDFSFPNAVSGPAPTPTGFVPRVIDQYLCAPGATTAC